MKEIKEIMMDSVYCEEVIICANKRRGSGESPDDPVRIIIEVYTKDGQLIAERDDWLNKTLS
jgi:hypothetical protein